MKKFILACIFMSIGPGVSFATSLATIRSMYTGTPVVLPSGTVITGTIISDRSGFNTHQLSVYIQDNTGGIGLRTDISSTYNLNDSISVDVSGDTLSEFNGGLQIEHVDLAFSTLLGTGTIVPLEVSIADVLNSMNGAVDAWESTLIKLNNVTITNAVNGIYSGSDTLTDATGSMILYTRTAATFANDPLPAGLVNVTGYLTEYFIPEIIIRNLNDVEVIAGVSEKPGAGKMFSLFPNPATGNLCISIANNEKAEISIADISGKVIFNTESAGSQQINISTTNFAAGIYFVHTRMGDEIATQKIVIIK